jgi:hypothetical protein
MESGHAVASSSKMENTKYQGSAMVRTFKIRRYSTIETTLREGKEEAEVDKKRNWL